MRGQPWSEVVGLAEISRGKVERSLRADQAVRERIARVVGVDRLDSLSADVQASPWLDGAVIEARWRASVEQTCGVSLEPFVTQLKGAFSVRVVPKGSPNAPAAGSQEVVIDLDGEDPPDVLEGDGVDLAAYVVEHLSLEVDPFPRKPGVSFEAPQPENPPSPFAVLKGLKDVQE